MTTTAHRVNPNHEQALALGDIRPGIRATVYYGKEVTRHVYFESYPQYSEDDNRWTGLVHFDGMPTTPVEFPLYDLGVSPAGNGEDFTTVYTVFDGES